MPHNANLGGFTLTEKPVAAGGHPVMVRAYPLRPDAGELPAGLLVARDKDGKVHAYGETLAEAVAAGDGAVKIFEAVLGPIKPGSLEIGDGVETFADDGFGGLAGSAGGSGNVDYRTGRVSLAFNAAPADQVAITAESVHVLAGALSRPCVAGKDGAALVIVSGPVVRASLLKGEAAPNAVALETLERLGVWPV
jgi:hypothetical protein